MLPLSACQQLLGTMLPPRVFCRGQAVGRPPATMQAGGVTSRHNGASLTGQCAVQHKRTLCSFGLAPLLEELLHTLMSIASIVLVAAVLQVVVVTLF
jgi:hypothetical protein